MRRNGLGALIFIVVLAAVLMGTSLAAGNRPLLGLDLQGGVSVVYEPVAGSEASGGDLDQAIEIIRRRVDALGVAEPEIARQGDAVVVQLPGVDDPDEALAVIGQTALLEFRPVLADLGNPTAPPPTVPDPTTDTTGGEPEGSTTDTSTDATDGSSTTTSAPAPDDEETGLGDIGGPHRRQTTEPTEPPVTEPPAADTSTTTTGDATPPDTSGDGTDDPSAGDDPSLDEGVVLPDREGNLYSLGPALLTGEALSGADAELGGRTGADWIVAITMRGGSPGIEDFNRAAAQCYSGAEVCPPTGFDSDTGVPRGRLAIVLDGEVQSSPVINSPSFARDQISISGAFTEDEAKDLALVLDFGALPVELEPQDTRTVSATLGKDALDAGVAAGLVGLALVALYMIGYYRLLGLVAMLSLGLSATLLWVVIAYLGESRGLALTLAGVTGIIVSIGVAVDSNVVFYEHLKENVSKGRTLRSSVDGSFASAFSTIVKADVASLIGAATLWFLTVGPVRGFAFYLGLATLLDLVSSYFFMRPLTVMLAKSPRLTRRHRLFGLPAAPEEAPA